MRHLLLALLLLPLLPSCDAQGDQVARSAAAPTGPWSGPGLRAVLDAQDHRRTADLCAMLKDSSATVRAAAALALASVQDTTARPCLLSALGDADGAVRSNSAFALGWVADSTALVLLNKASDTERDTTVLRVMLESGFRAELRLNKHDAMWCISYLQSGNTDIRTRAAQALARLSKEELVGSANDVMMAVDSEHDPAVRMFLVGALKHNATPAVTEKLKALAQNDSLAMIRIAAVRALGAKEDPALAPFLLARVDDSDPGVQQVAVEQLQRIKASLDGDAFWKTAQEHGDYGIKLPLYGLVMRHGTEQTRMVCRSLMESMSRQDLGPYWNAALITALGPSMAEDSLMALVRSDRHPAERQAACVVAIAQIRERMAVSRFASPDAQYAGLRNVVQQMIQTGDAGLISSAAELLEQEDPATIALLLPVGAEQGAYAPLHTVRDLETRILLDKAVAKRDSKSVPAHTAPPFNHPIDLARLDGLKEGQRYRITTTEGEIVLELEPGTAPGSCVAFDSLVTAGYYNGKAFHRIVPNFVAQGGCPRGDGYGGMPWTLRTEIGPKGFTEGAVGLASAGHDTESCQFFIMTAAAPHLDGKYTRFAHVVSGLDVAKKLQVGDVIAGVERMP
ncbi:MAG: peptidylprolyl isomerase [Flavobacteriales bacterium]|nr:peptidylprolyl isomerase [Flavobacteriales bacterium]